MSIFNPFHLLNRLAAFVRGRRGDKAAVHDDDKSKARGDTLVTPIKSIGESTSDTTSGASNALGLDLSGGTMIDGGQMTVKTRAEGLLDQIWSLQELRLLIMAHATLDVLFNLVQVNSTTAADAITCLYRTMLWDPREQCPSEAEQGHLRNSSTRSELYHRAIRNYQVVVDGDSFDDFITYAPLVQEISLPGGDKVIVHRGGEGIYAKVRTHAIIIGGVLTGGSPPPFPVDWEVARPKCDLTITLLMSDAVGANTRAIRELQERVDIDTVILTTDDLRQTVEDLSKTSLLPQLVTINHTDRHYVLTDFNAIVCWCPKLEAARLGNLVETGATLQAGARVVLVPTLNDIFGLQYQRIPRLSSLDLVVTASDLNPRLVTPESPLAPFLEVVKIHIVFRRPSPDWSTILDSANEPSRGMLPSPCRMADYLWVLGGSEWKYNFTFTRGFPPKPDEDRMEAFTTRWEELVKIEVSLLNTRDWVHRAPGWLNREPAQ